MQSGRPMSDKQIETHPVQVPAVHRKHIAPRAPVVVTMKAYEVYCHLYGSQKALITGNCRGGMSTGELIAFLYAATFPKEEWRKRVDEAFKGMQNL